MLDEACLDDVAQTSLLHLSPEVHVQRLDTIVEIDTSLQGRVVNSCSSEYASTP